MQISITLIIIRIFGKFFFMVYQNDCRNRDFKFPSRVSPIKEISNDKEDISFYNYDRSSVSIKQLIMQNLHSGHHNNNNDRGTWNLSTEQRKRERERKKITWKMFTTNMMIVCSSGILRFLTFFPGFLFLLSIYGFVWFHLDSWYNFAPHLSYNCCVFFMFPF